MSDWATRRLADVVKLRRGHDLPARARRPGSVPVISSGATEGWHDTAIANGPGVVLGRATNIGRPKWVSGPYWPHNTTLYVEDFLGNEPRWVFHLFETLDLGGYNSGSVQPMLNRNFIADIQVPVPSLDEQRRIAAVLRALDDLIETNQRLTALLGPQARRAASQAPSLVKLSSVARMAETRQEKPSGLVEHYSLPAFDNGATPEVVDGTLIQSNKLTVREPSVLVSRLNPKWERCWLAFPGENAVASTEFVPLLGLGIQIEELWAVTSAPAYWGQMRERVTGTTGSHQRVDKSALLDLVVPDVRELPGVVRKGITELVRTASRLRDEIVDLTRTRDELLPLLMSGRVRVEDVEGVV